MKMVNSDDFNCCLYCWARVYSSNLLENDLMLLQHDIEIDKDRPIINVRLKSFLIILYMLILSVRSNNEWPKCKTV
jgi:hypothetical protein